MLNTPAAILVREHRREVERLARVRSFAASAAVPTPTKPQRTPIIYTPDLSRVPPEIVDRLRSAIAAIERHDRRVASPAPRDSAALR